MILAAAIRGNDGTIWTLPPPARHANIGWHMIENGHESPFPSGDAQGFIASHIGFVDRVTAKEIALAHKQILDGQGFTKELFSEDLW